MPPERPLNEAGFFISCASNQEVPHEEEEKGRQVLIAQAGVFTDSRRLPSSDVDWTDDRKPDPYRVPGFHRRQPQ